MKCESTFQFRWVCAGLVSCIAIHTAHFDQQSSLWTYFEMYFMASFLAFSISLISGLFFFFFFFWSLISLSLCPGSILSHNGKIFRISKIEAIDYNHINRMSVVCHFVFVIAECIAWRFVLNCWQMDGDQFYFLGKTK